MLVCYVGHGQRIWLGGCFYLLWGLGVVIVGGVLLFWWMSVSSVYSRFVVLK